MAATTPPSVRRSSFSMSSQTNSPSSSSRRWLLATLALLAASIALFAWEPWSAQTPQQTPAVTEPADEARNATVLDADGNQRATPEHASGTEPTGDARARTQVAARTVLRGTYTADASFRLDDGNALLMPAPAKLRGGAMGLASFGMDMARRSAKRRADLAAGKQVDEESLEQEMLALIGRAPPVMTAPLGPRGNFTFLDPPEGSYQVVLDHPVLLNRQQVLAEVVLGQEHELGALETRIGAGLVVVVSDAAGQPLQGAKLELGRPIDVSQFMDPSKLGNTLDFLPRMIPFEGQTDERGIRLFRGLPIEDEWLLEVHSRGFVSDYRSFELPAGRETVLSVQLRRGTTLAVTVLDPDGAPVSGVPVEVDIPNRPLPARIKGMAQMERNYSRGGTTGADGVAQIVGLPVGHAQVAARPPGYFDLLRPVALAAGDGNAVTLQLDRGLTISGRLVDVHGAPISAGRVLPTAPREDSFLGLDSGKFMGNVLTVRLWEDGIRAADDGTFSIGGLEAGDVVAVAAVAPGHDRGQVDAVSAGAEGVEIVLQELGTLRGVVVAEPDGEPVTAFKVELQQRAFVMFDHAVLGQGFGEREDGSFVLEDVPRDKFTVAITADGHAPWSESVDFSEGTVDLGEIRLQLPASVRGTTVDPTGVPLPGVTVRVSRGGAADSLMMAQTLGAEMFTSDEEGRFHIEGLTGKRVRLIADKDGYATLRTRPIPLQPGACSEDIVLELDAGGILDGVLTDDEGRPLSGWRAQATHTSGVSMRAALTDANGVFVLEGLMPGTTKVDCMPGDYVSRFAGSGAQDLEKDGFNIAKTIGNAMKWIASDRVVIRSGERTELEMVFRAPDEMDEEGAVRVHGTVRVADVPLEDGMVFLSAAGRTALGPVAQVEAGIFTFEGVPPGTYRCRIQAGILSGAVGQSRTIEVPEGAREHRIELTMPGGELAGTVEDETGRPVAGVAVLLSSSAHAELTTDRMDLGEGSVVTDDTGNFRFHGLAAGSYHLVAREVLSGHERSAQLARIDLRSGERRSDLQLTLARGGTLHVHVRAAGQARTNGLVTLLDPNGNPLGLFHRKLTDRNGSVSFSGLPEGAYRVVVDAPGLAPRVSDVIWHSGVGESSLDIELSAGVPTVVQVGGTLPPELAAHTVTYVVRRADGQLVKTGQVTLPALSGAAAAEVSLGSLESGRYVFQLESERLGVLRGEGEVPRAERAVVSLVVRD